MNKERRSILRLDKNFFYPFNHDKPLTLIRRNTNQQQNTYVYDHQAIVDTFWVQPRASTIPRSNEKHYSPVSEQIQETDPLDVLVLIQMFACDPCKENMKKENTLKRKKFCMQYICGHKKKKIYLLHITTISPIKHIQVFSI